MAYIDREKLIEAIRYNHRPLLSTGSLAEVFCNSIEWTINEQPTANVEEVRQGEWEKVHYSEGGIAPYKHTCSCCGKSYWDCYAENRFPFCPNCGAKMKGE